MTISSKWHKARNRYLCVNCETDIWPGERYLHSYGMTEDDRKPYGIKLCRPCGEQHELRCSYDYVNRVYAVNAVPGGRVRVDGKKGTILQPDESTAHVHVRFDGEKRRSICHPTWMVEYLGVAK